MPIKLEYGDRRYVVIEPSSKHVNDTVYFKPLYDTFKQDTSKDFYNNLFTFFMKRDIREFNPRIIPQTEARNMLLKASQTSYELFIQDNISKFINGYPRCDAYPDYINWVNENGFSKCSIKTFKEKITKFCKDTKITVNHKQIHVYKLKDEVMDRLDLTEHNDIVNSIVNGPCIASEKEQELDEIINSII